MKEEQKKSIKERYEQSLQKGERFWPDSIYKDLLMALAIFITLIMLATFIGVPAEPKADPSDSTYVPRPEWYFLFLFKFLALYGQIPVIGKIEWLATVIIPVIFIGLIVFLPFIDRSPSRYYGKRVFAIGIMSIVLVSMVSLTFLSNIPTTSSEGIYIPGILQTIGGLIVPALGYILLALMNFAFKKAPASIMIGITIATTALMVLLTFATLALAPAPVVEETTVAETLSEQIVVGQDIYSVYCTECHGEDGSTAIIEGVAGLEGEKITPINSRDVLYTITDPAMYEVIAYGRPSAGMTPFGKAYGGELSRSEIDYIIAFMRYNWDDRFELPPEAQAASAIPALAEGEIPSYEVHIQPLVKRYCVSCHRPGKTNNNYTMQTYEEVLTTGDNSDRNVIAGSMDSYLVVAIQGNEILDPETNAVLIHQMPPSKLMSEEYIDMLIRWVMGGMPNTADEAQQSNP